MPDYTQGKIYKIVKKDDHTRCYVGSTVVELKLRFQKHKADSKFKPTPFHKKVDGKWEEWEIILIENYVCSSKKKLTKREGELIRELGTLNFEIAGRTPKEYYQDNLEYCREKNKKYSKQYGDLHREEIREKWKIYFEEKKDEINEKRRQKWAENKEECCKKQQAKRELKKAQQSEEEKLEQKKKIAEQRKKHRDENRDEINRKKREAYALKKLEKLKI